VNPAFSLSGKRILITGAASGMGRGFAQHAANDGASVGLVDLNGSGLKETVGLLDRGEVPTATLDLGVWEEVEIGVGSIVERLGGLDIVANIAGWDKPGVFWEQPLELWERLISINLWSVLHVLRATVPVFIDAGRGGRIVNVASDAGRVGSKGETVYAAAKGGVIAVTKSLARELAPYRVAVNVIAPGPTNTPLGAAEVADNPKLAERLERAIPWRRVGEVEDMANALAFLASDAADYITGQVLSISGGLTMVG